MKLLLLIFAGLVALLHADSFTFSYDFNAAQPGTRRVSGTFDGTTEGGYVINPSNFTVAFSGLDMLGPVYASAFTPGVGYVAPEIAGDGALVNLTLSNFDATFPNEYAPGYWYFNLSYLTWRGSYAAWAQVDHALALQTGLPMLGEWSNIYNNGSWTLTNVTAIEVGGLGRGVEAASVPDDGAMWLMILAVFAILATTRRVANHREGLT